MSEPRSVNRAIREPRGVNRAIREPRGVNRATREPRSVNRTTGAPRGTCLVVVAAGALLATDTGCRGATEIVVEVTTDLPCDRYKGTEIFVDAPGGALEMKGAT